MQLQYSPYHAGRSLRLLPLLLLIGCTPAPDPEPVQEIKLYQTWQMQPGDHVQNYPVLGGMGDLSIQTNNNPIYAPFPGTARPDPRHCTLFSSPDVPAYLFRLCGLTHPRYGSLNQGDVLGHATTLSFATLRKQPDGSWALVEPSTPMLERTLKP